MSELATIFTSAGVAEDKLVTIVKMLRENPLAALSAVQELQLPNDVIQQIMGIVMSNPSAIEELAQSMGLSEEDISAIKEQIPQSPES